MKNKTRKGNKKQRRGKQMEQYGKGALEALGGLATSAIGSTGGTAGLPNVGGLINSAMGGGAMTGAPITATHTQPNTKDIMYASEIAAKELIQKICQALNPPGSQVFLNIASNSLKTYLEGEDANKMMNAQLKGFIESILDGIINDNSQSPAIFRETFKTHQTHIQNQLLLPAITKVIGNGMEIKEEEIQDLVDKIESNILELNRQ